LTLAIHELTRNFPKEEMFILTSQIKRAADSVALNIAEGSTGQSKPEFKRFLRISVRSCIEVVACLHIALKRNLVSEDELQKIKNDCTEISKMIFGLINSLDK
jgi:four helix bundle protein